MFTAARDKSPNVFYSHNGERLGTYDGHNGAVYSLDVDYYSRRLLTASADNTAKLWNVQTGEILFEWEFKTPVRSIEFAIGDREALILTDARMGNPGLLNVYAMATDVAERMLMAWCFGFQLTSIRSFPYMDIYRSSSTYMCCPYPSLSLAFCSTGAGHRDSCHDIYLAVRTTITVHH